jgi:hypothetical protein
MSNKIPELVIASAEKAINAYCENKVPIRLRDQIRLYGKKRGASLTLIESRPAFMNKAEWTENPVAQFRYPNGL